MPQMFDDVGEIVEEALRRVGKRVVLALPLGIGKPNLIANEFFRRARADATLDLTIFTALSLRKPTGSSDLEKAFIEPLAARIFGNYPELDYLAGDARRNDVPAERARHRVLLRAGLAAQFPARAVALSVRELHARGARAAGRGVNVIAHVVAKRMVGRHHRNQPRQQSRCHRRPAARSREAARRRAAGGDAGPGASRDALHARRAPMSAPTPSTCCSTIRATTTTCSRRRIRRWRTVDHAIGLHASSLVRDGGTLQIGIGELGDSIVYSLLLRHQQNEAWRRALVGCGHASAARALIDAVGGRAPFSTGLFGATEMFVDQMLDLYRAGILRRRVYDYLPLQRALAANGSSTRIDAGAARGPAGRGRRAPRSTRGDVAALQARRRAAQRDAASTTAASSRPTACASRRISAVRRRAPRWRANAWGSSCRAARSCTPDSCSARAPSTRRCSALPEIRAAAVRHARRGLHQPALRRRYARCAWRSAITRASSTPP